MRANEVPKGSAGRTVRGGSLRIETGNLLWPAAKGVSPQENRALEQIRPVLAGTG